MSTGGSSVTIFSRWCRRYRIPRNRLVVSSEVESRREHLVRTVTFNPSSIGPLSDIMTVISDGSNPDIKIHLSGTGVDIRGLPDARWRKQITDCKLIIDREKPLSSSRNPDVFEPKAHRHSAHTKTFEPVFLDYQSGQATLTPDVASSIVQGLLPSLGKISEFYEYDGGLSRHATTDQCAASSITDVAIPAPLVLVKDMMRDVLGCLTQLSIKAIAIYRSPNHT